MTTTLTDRYVHAATRWLPGRTRDEVAAELRERIGDTVAARGGTPDAEREALEELGDPLRVAVDYTGREPALIGPRLFFPWLRLTTLLALIVGPIVFAVAVITSAIEGDPIGQVIVAGLGTLVETTVHVVFWTTVVFAVVDWTGAKADFDTWSIDQLPEPDTSGRLPELIGGVAVSAALAAGVLWQHFGSPFTDDGDPIPLADPALWSWYLPLVLLVLFLEVVHLVWIQRSGWTWAVAHTNTLIGLLFAVPTVIVLANDALVNPELIAHLDWNRAVEEDVTRWAAIGVAVIGAWEILDGYRRAWLRSRAQ